MKPGIKTRKKQIRWENNMIDHVGKLRRENQAKYMARVAENSIGPRQVFAAPLVRLLKISYYYENIA